MGYHDSAVDRRTFLKLGSGLAVTSTVAGCIGDADDEYPSQDLRWIVPYSAGGLFDGYSRAVAENLPDHLPNDVDVAVENVTGAGGRTGANELYRADPDGYTIGLVNDPGFVIFQMLEDTEYDMTNFSYIGRIAFDPHVMVVHPESEFNSVEDLQEADEVVFGAPGMSTNAANFAILAGEVLDFNTEFVTGFEGMAEVRTAVMREDVDAALSVVTPAAPQIEDGDLQAVVVFDVEPGDYAPDAPTIGELGYEEFGETFRLNWMAAAPPDMEQERLSILEDAFLDALDSEGMHEWAEDAGASIDPAGSDEALSMVEETDDVFGQYLDTIEEYH